MADMRPLQSELYQGTIGREGQEKAEAVAEKRGTPNRSESSSLPAHPSGPAPPARAQDTLVRTGAWLFRRRTWLPVPIAVALLLLPSSNPLFWWGVALTAAGEFVRLIAVREIGVISRTRSDRLGPLISTGPFSRVRNPLYLGNIAIWCGFALSAGLPALVLPIIAVLGLEYHAIVRWEEQLLEARLGESYRVYAARVPRWLPRLRVTRGERTSRARRAFTWQETIFSERGTLIAIGAGYALLWVKSRI
jgi:protein-S-isoprenylcysteine O-methyltransferase Ste14